MGIVGGQEGRPLFYSRTLLVVGAGASCEAKLPSGNELKKIIHGMLEAQVLDEQIKRALGMFARHHNGQSTMPKLLDAAQSIREAMPQALSIDNYLDARRGHAYIEIVGKIAITRAILKAERMSLMYFDPLRERRPPNDAIYDTWYNRFFQALTESVSGDEIDNLFNNLSIITFNYDRCIEHFLAYSLRNYYRITEKESRYLAKNVKIFHPLGSVGELGWGDLGSNAVFFGGANYEPDLLKISHDIKTFSERIHDETMIQSMRMEVENAEVIVFLGFAFHPQNMELIAPQSPTATKRVFATAKGISESDRFAIKKQLFALLKSENNISIDMQNIICKELFDEYWRSLTRL